MGPNIHRHPSQIPFTHHPYTDTHPYLISPMAPNTYRHTHALNPFTHGPKHSHTPIPDPLSAMAQTQTPTPNPFHPWSTILTHTHAINPFTHGPKHSHTPRHRCRHPSLGHYYPTYIHTVCNSLIVMFHDGSWCFMVVHDDSWCFMVVRNVSWWFVMVRGSFTLKFSRKYHVTHYLTNQSPRFSIKSHFEWDFVMVHGGL